MFAFFVSQIIGLCLFITLNYGVLSYINYRKNQASTSEHKKTERFVLDQLRIAVSLFLVMGLIYKINNINQYFSIDYTYILFNTLSSVQQVEFYTL